MKEENTVGIPGYVGVDPNWVQKTLDTVHDIAQEFAYMRGVDLTGLDEINKSYIDSAFALAEKRAMDEFFKIMLEIRQARTPRG